LYDHDADSGELTNLAGDPAHKQTLEQMQQLLNQVTASPTTSQVSGGQ
jgi:hypothetical protein